MQFKQIYDVKKINLEILLNTLPVVSPMHIDQKHKNKQSL